MNNLMLYRLRLIQKYIRDYGKDAGMAERAARDDVLDILYEAIADIKEQLLDEIRRNGT